ncbi:hypothetical protein [Lacticaseibacillus paracasei]|uniref:hypothetical protein n=1 Tax=Lacticaseibacillus paracasei TaxID=1597 RepID=UPI0031F6DD7E
MTENTNDSIDLSRLVYICENCGKTARYPDPEAAFNDGWDYPPRLGKFGVISPRTCGNCTINTTMWWQLVAEHVAPEDLAPKYKETLIRILNEPESILAP